MLNTALFDCVINKKCWSVDGGRGICPRFSSPPRGIWQLKSPHPGNLPSKAKKMLTPGGQPWAQVELKSNSNRTCACAARNFFQFWNHAYDFKPNCTPLRDGPLENLWGGGGRQNTKKIFAHGKIKWKKNSCTPINPKKYSCYGLKKIHTRNLITTKNSCGSKIPLPPVTFRMVRPLVQFPL